MKMTLAFAAAFMLGISAFAADDEMQDLTKFAPESKDYKLVYVVDAFKGVDKLGNIQYVKDYSPAFVGKTFTKVAYFMRLVGTNDKVQQVFVTMDAFTKDAKEIGVPAMNPKKAFQMQVANLTVKSDVEGVKNGTFAHGNIEFWATNYGAGNSAKVPGADDKRFDFGDQPANNGNYGSMQIHNFMEKQTVMALNHWVAVKNTEVGIGNNKSGEPDWTFSNSGKNFKSAQVLVLVK